MTRLTRKYVIAILTTVAIFSASVITLLHPSSPEEGNKKTAVLTPILTVTTVQPLQTQVPITLLANGRIAPWEETIISSESNNLPLKEVRVNVGDIVHKGQVLATFAAEAVQVDVAQAYANLLEAKANALNASSNAKRARALQESGALSRQQIDLDITAEQIAQAKVEAAKALLAGQQLRLKHTQLLAPDNGIISARTATIGTVTSVGTELFRLIRQGRLEWRAEVATSEVSQLKTGTPALITAANGAHFQGKVRKFAPTVDSHTLSVLVYVNMAAAPDKLAPAKAGMFAKGEFYLGTSTALTVPQQSVVVRDGFSYVFYVNPDSRVRRMKVLTGRRVGDRIELMDPILPNTTLVASGAVFLNDGDLVKIVQPQRR